MTPPANQLDRIREAMTLQGFSQKRLAQAMGLPQSAISNLFTGKRHLKFDELVKFESVLGIISSEGDNLVPIPLIRAHDLIEFEAAMKNSNVNFPNLFKGSGSRMFAFVEHEPRLSNERMRHIYCIVDPDERHLVNNSIYVLLEDTGYMLAEYKEDPPRLQSMWNPDWQPGPRLVGSFPFTVLGGIRQFGWNPNLTDLIIGLTG